MKTMKTITMDFETYEKEIADAKECGASTAVFAVLDSVRNNAKLNLYFQLREPDSWDKQFMRERAEEIMSLFKAQKEKA